MDSSEAEHCCYNSLYFITGQCQLIKLTQFAIHWLHQHTFHLKTAATRYHNTIHHITPHNFFHRKTAATTMFKNTLFKKTQSVFHSPLYLSQSNMLKEINVHGRGILVPIPIFGVYGELGKT